MARKPPPKSTRFTKVGKPGPNPTRRTGKRIKSTRSKKKGA